MRQYHSHSVEQDVEWLYAFDVHANAFFCSFLLTYVLQVPFYVTGLFLLQRIRIGCLTLHFLLLVNKLQYFLLPVLLGRSVLACILSNTLYALATVWYAYITHLGYRGTQNALSSSSYHKHSMSGVFCPFRFAVRTSLTSFAVSGLFVVCTALPFLGNTQVFLWYPSVVIGLGWALSVVLVLLGLRINMTRIIMAFHFG
jgi:hypothetical protein